MRQRVLDRDPLLGIKRERLGQKVNRQGVCVGEELREWPPFAEGQRADIVARSSRGDGVELVEGRRAEDVQDERELVVVVATGE